MKREDDTVAGRRWARQCCQLGCAVALWLCHAAPPCLAANHPLAGALDDSPAKREETAAALHHDPSAAALATLWLLAHDPDPRVVGAALSAAIARCAGEAHAICLASLGFFMEADGGEVQTSWRARTTLLAEEPELARLYASRETKLDVISLLAGRISMGSPARPWLAALELLSKDPEPDVQEAASAVLLQFER